jgi:2-polyprenyl-3-methyl-5-hydroxy-6-metoxy-1,4-benzoquinol methylase
METFRSTKKLFKESFVSILSDYQSHEIDEAAFPAYAHSNPLIEYLFWERVKEACKHALTMPKGSRMLDFGCGSGVLSYMLAKNDFDVMATDLDFGPISLVKEKIKFPDSIEFFEGDIINKELPGHQFDAIFALDVLEHINNIPDYIDLFRRLLKPDGIIIVSGPTENILYKIGRKIAGDEFTGHYHVTNIKKIKAQFQEKMEVKTLRKLLFPVILFELFQAKET